MALALLLIIFKGSPSESQGNIFKSFLTQYIDETAAAVVTNPTQDQLADINSVFASTGGERAPVPSIISTIQDNSIVSRGTILTDIIDQFTDRGAQISTYTVQEGDTLSFIASDYGVSVNTIIWANSLKSADDIKPGMELKIPPVTGVIHKVKKGDTVASVAKKYGVDEDKIISFNSLPASGDLQVDDEIIVPGGKIQSPVAPKAAPVYAVLKRFANLPLLDGYFSFPTATNYRLTQGLHGRNGVDLADSCGTPVYAAADGTVNLAKNSGYNGGFGRFVRITHPNSTETLYAHASQVLVSIGQYVTRGEQIAVMGTTGRSTGCHVHFEVHGAQNPFAKGKSAAVSAHD
jgi:murein DD-endopeptidase MepM/ murein hydrolase activator NlpD